MEDVFDIKDIFEICLEVDAVEIILNTTTSQKKAIAFLVDANSRYSENAKFKIYMRTYRDQFPKKHNLRRSEK